MKALESVKTRQKTDESGCFGVQLTFLLPIVSACYLCFEEGKKKSLTES